MAHGGSTALLASCYVASKIAARVGYSIRRDDKARVGGRYIVQRV